MDIHNIRRKNVERLIEEHGSQARLAELIDTAPAYLSQIVTGQRNPGESFCRKVEKQLGMPAWHMDILHDTPADIVDELNAGVLKLPGNTQMALLNLFSSIQQTHSILSTDERQLISYFRECDIASKKTVLEVASAQAKLKRNSSNK